MADLLTYAEDAQILERAKAILCERMAAQITITSWQGLSDYLAVTVADERAEVFRVLFLNRKNRLIECREMGRGTIDHVPVHVREVARAALLLDASAVILTHNHPSGDPTPSKQDIDMTKKIRNGLALFDVVVLDHAITGAGNVLSMKAEGLF